MNILLSIVLRQRAGDVQSDQLVTERALRGGNDKNRCKKRRSEICVCNTQTQTNDYGYVIELFIVRIRITWRRQGQTFGTAMTGERCVSLGQCADSRHSSFPNITGVRSIHPKRTVGDRCVLRKREKRFSVQQKENEMRTKSEAKQKSCAFELGLFTSFFIHDIDICVCNVELSILVAARMRVRARLWILKIY